MLALPLEAEIISASSFTAEISDLDVAAGTVGEGGGEGRGTAAEEAGGESGWAWSARRTAAAE